MWSANIIGTHSRLAPLNHKRKLQTIRKWPCTKGTWKWQHCYICNKAFSSQVIDKYKQKNSLWFSFINSFWWDIFSLRFSSIITRYVTTSSKYLLISALETVHSSETGTTPATIRLVTPQRETQSCVISFVWKLFEWRFYSI